MDRRSWLWRRKSLEKSPGKSESTSSSQHSERFSDDQDALRASQNNFPLNHAQSEEVASKTGNKEAQMHVEVHETVKTLTEKLSAALLIINAKEDSVKQHMKVAEEAVSGWEKAEKELTFLKQQLEIAKAEPATTINDLKSKIKAIEKENTNLKSSLVSLSEELKIRILENEFSTQTAETASKHHLEKVAKLEAECRRLKAAARKASSVRMESLTDIGLMDDFLEMERLAALPETNNNGINTAEFEAKFQKIENEKSKMEMALAEAHNQLKTSSDKITATENKLFKLQKELDLANESKQTAISEMKSILQVSEETKETLKSQLQLLSAEFAAKIEAADSEVNKLQEKVCLLEKELEEEKALSTDFATKLDTVEAQFESVCSEVGILERKIDDERTLSAEVSAKCQNLENELLRNSSSNSNLKVKQEKELALAAGKFAECQKTIASLGHRLKSLAPLDDFMLETEEFMQNKLCASEDTGNCNLSNGKVKCKLCSSSSSPLFPVQSGKDCCHKVEAVSV